MMELTKEEQIQAIYDLKVGYTLGHADIAMLKAMARQLLAGLEKKPVAWPNHCDSTIPAALRFLAEKPRPIYGNSPYNTEHLYQLAREIEAMARRPLYAAPQLPQPAVVDDDKFRADFERWMIEDEKCIVGSSDPYPAGIESSNWRAWNACRAAMLQGAAGNSPAIPDGWVACSERMPSEDGNYWGWWSESKRQGPVWFIKSDLQAQFQSSEITHWMPLPAAPKQEVK